MLGDGHVSASQLVVTLGNKEGLYVDYVREILSNTFCTPARVSTRAGGYADVTIGSKQLVAFMKKCGCVSHKTKQIPRPPLWILHKKEYCEAFVRGLFDTDGSVYRLRYGVQISFTSYSPTILSALQKALKKLQYTVSKQSAHRIYITKQSDVDRFFRKLQPKNDKHLARYTHFRVGTQAVKEGAL
jgi:hypothetical protein